MTLPWDKSFKEIYKEYRPGDIVWLANTQLICDVAKDNPSLVSRALYEMWSAIKNHVERKETKKMIEGKIVSVSCDKGEASITLSCMNIQSDWYMDMFEVVDEIDGILEAIKCLQLGYTDLLEPEEEV